MKKLLILAALTISAYTAQAQTNIIAYRITVDGQNTSWTLDGTSGGAKDKARVAGLVYAYNLYVSGVATNDTPLAMGPWLKRQHLVLVDDYTSQKQTADNAAVLAKLQVLLTTQSDLLSNTDLSNLATIAAKLP